MRSNAAAAWSACPAPILDHKEIVLGHGGGGRLTRQLMEQVVMRAFRNETLDKGHDGAICALGRERLAFTTDSYIVNPIVFPGGDIGQLAVNGTVNDLAMCGARPLFLSVSLILEEGLPVDDLWQILCSMQQAADHAGVSLVTGDTKVVDRGKGDGIFINTSGIGAIPEGISIDPASAANGDAILLSGPIASHGMAIMSVREGLEFESPIKSDTAALNGLVETMLRTCKDIHVLRDPTRGGVASALNEIADKCGLGILLNESSIPVEPAVQGACEILGLDPLYVANEGKLLAVVPRASYGAVLQAMRAHPLGRGSQLIGGMVREHPGVVIMKTHVGGTRVVDMLSGDQLPRIC
jgi:hydrogenase expression/formation protein HypE